MGDRHLHLAGSAGPGWTVPAGPPAPRPAFDVRSKLEGPTAVIWVEGEVDLGSADVLQRSLVSLVEGGASNVVLDLGSVSFLDCTGLRVLLNARQLTGSRGGFLRLDRVPAPVRRVLLLTGSAALLDPGPGVWPTGL